MRVFLKCFFFYEIVLLLTTDEEGRMDGFFGLFLLGLLLLLGPGLRGFAVHSTDTLGWAGCDGSACVCVFI